MLLNETKCHFMVVEPSGVSRNEVAKIKIQNKIIKESKNVKLLGITLDNNILMNDHINNICKQAGNKLYALARISTFLNEQKRKMLMKSFVLSQFNYCPIVWMYCKRKTNNLINKIHERALRIAYNDYESDFESLLKKDSSVTIHQRNIQALFIEIYKTLHNQNPTFMNDIFCLKEHRYPLRKQHLSHPNPRTVTYGLESFGYKALQLWDALPRDIQNTDNLSIFKKYISDHCSKLCNCNLCKLYFKNLGYIDNK